MVLVEALDNRVSEESIVRKIGPFAQSTYCFLPP
jgi:hypothetical protein